MTHDWSAYLGHHVDGRFPLRELLWADQQEAAFLTEVDGVERVLRAKLGQTASSEARHSSWALAAANPSPNLLQVLTAGHTELDAEPAVYAVTERPDDSLSNVLPERPLTEQETREVVTAVLAVLEQLHRDKIAHGDIQASTILAVGDKIKLSPDSLTAVPGQRSTDMLQLGATIVEILTQHRPATPLQPEDSAALNRVPSPFAEIARACLDPEASSRWTVREASRALEGLPPEPRIIRKPPSESAAPAAGGTSAKRVAAYAVAVLAIAAVAIPFLRRGNSEASNPVQQAPAPVVQPRPSAPSPVPVPEAPRELPRRTETATRARATEGNWGVVAAIYRDRKGAEKRASSMQKRWPNFHPEIVPPGNGARRYLIVLGRGMDRDDADALRRRALSAGMPRDTYVTKITANGSGD